MEWLSQNALWILFAVGVIVLMRRGGMMCGMGRHRHGFGGGSKHPDEIPRDPVTGNPVDKDKALVSIFQGHTYLFESESSRAEFEKNPQQFAHNQTHHHHGGCC